jgi:hypothetical protein
MKKLVLMSLFVLGTLFVISCESSKDKAKSSSSEDEIITLVKEVEKTLPTSLDVKWTVYDISKERKTIELSLKFYESIESFDGWGLSEEEKAQYRKRAMDAMRDSFIDAFMTGYEDALEGNGETKVKPFMLAIGPLLKAMVRNENDLSLKIYDNDGLQETFNYTLKELECGVLGIGKR